jgi:hypothetical protein
MSALLETSGRSYLYGLPVTIAKFGKFYTIPRVGSRQKHRSFLKIGKSDTCRLKRLGKRDPSILEIEEICLHVSDAAVATTDVFRR